jgi:hypothetical protein
MHCNNLACHPFNLGMRSSAPIVGTRLDRASIPAFPSRSLSKTEFESTRIATFGSVSEPDLVKPYT